MASRTKLSFLGKSSGKWTVELADALYNHYNKIPKYFELTHLIEFFMWDFKLLSCFLRLKSYYGDYGLLDVTHKLLEAWSSRDPLAFRIHFEYFQLQDPVPEVLKMKKKLRAEFSSSFPEIVPILLPPTSIIIPSPNFVLEFIDAVGENIRLLVVTNDPSSWFFVDGPKDQIEEVLKELTLLRFFVLFVSMKCTDPETRRIFFTHVLIEASHIAMVVLLYAPFQPHRDGRVLAIEMNALLSDLLEIKIRPVRKIYIDVLRDLKSTIQPGLHPCIIQTKDASTNGGFVETPTYNLVELRNLLRASLIHPPILDLKFYLQDIDISIVDAGLLIYSLHDIKEGTMLEDVNRAVGLDLPSNIQPVMEMIYLIIRRAFQSNLPRIYGLGSVDVLLNNIKEFQGRYADSLFLLMNQLQIIQNLLHGTQPSFKDAAEERTILFLIYEVEFVIYACIRKEVPQWCLECWLRNIIEEIILCKIKEEIPRKNMLPHEPRDTSTAQIPSTLPTNPRMTKEIVGFEEVRKELREKLLKGCRHLDVLSIVGMPGLGKTTLAYKVYSEESIISHFDIRAQCCVSQVYKRKDLLLDILHNASGENPSSTMDEADVAEKLRRILMAKRYLILVDDVWEASTWDDLRPCFYDANNGSRIILTTRHLEVAKYVVSISEPIPLRMFNDNESWKLLEDRVFGKGSCSPSLEEIGKQIAKMCGGLPLSIVLVAGILVKMENKQECWIEVAATLSSQIYSDSKAIVEHSYQNLPYYLKPCFLYLGAFLEDRVIDASLLTRLWISESFIKSCEGKSLEDIAQGYLEDLIARNLVMASKRNYVDGKVKAFRIHDILLEFCKKRATKMNFFQWIKWDQDVDRPPCIYSLMQNAQPRLVFCEQDNLVDWFLSYSFVGSVISWDATPRPRIELYSILSNFGFVNVLHLGHYVRIDDFPSNLVHLKYLSARTTQRSIPSSISNLWNLETLILEIDFRSFLVPATLWKLAKLRNLHISGFSLHVESEEELPEDSSKLDELRTLSTPRFSCVSDVKLMFQKAPNLRELRCKFWCGSSDELSVLDFPTWLEKLHISSEFRIGTFPVCISAPNLKELRIIRFKVSLQHLSTIAQLQNLQALVLTTIEFDDEKWDQVTDDEFPQLKLLKLKDSTLREWTVSDDAFPNLERLVLRECRIFKGIPSCLGDILSLKSIEVERCNRFVEKSARDIRETQVEDYQNADFKLFIKEARSHIKDSDDDEEEEEEDHNNDDDEKEEKRKT